MASREPDALPLLIQWPIDGLSSAPYQIDPSAILRDLATRGNPLLLTLPRQEDYEILASDAVGDALYKTVDELLQIPKSGDPTLKDALDIAISGSFHRLIILARQPDITEEQRADLGSQFLKLLNLIYGPEIKFHDQRAFNIALSEKGTHLRALLIQIFASTQDDLDQIARDGAIRNEFFQILASTADQDGHPYMYYISNFLGRMANRTDRDFPPREDLNQFRNMLHFMRLIADGNHRKFLSGFGLSYVLGRRHREAS